MNNIVILDTNFVIYCIKQKIYFKEEIENLLLGAKILIPLQVKKELQKIIEGKTLANYADKQKAKVSLDIVSRFEEINLVGKYTDQGIIKYCKKEKDKNEVYVATLDTQLALKLKSLARIIKIKGLKSLFIN